MQIVKLPNGKYRVRVWVGAQHPQFTGFNLKLLKSRALTLLYEYQQGKFNPRDRYKLKFQEAVDKYKTLYSHPNGQHHDDPYLDALIELVGATTLLEEMRTDYLHELRNKMLSLGWSKNTINRRWTLLASVFRENGYKSDNPVRTVKKFKNVDVTRLRYLTKDEIKVLLGKLEGEEQAFAQVALNTGFRLGNLERLRWEDVDAQNGIVHAIKTKSGKSYAIPMNKSLVYTLKCIKDTHKNVSGQIFKSRQWGRVFRKVFRELGWTDVSVHTLRHTFASQLVMAGVDLYTVSKLMGHSTIKMTERYAHLSPNFMERAVDKLRFGSGK